MYQNKPSNPFQLAPSLSQQSPRQSHADQPSLDDGLDDLSRLSSGCAPTAKALYNWEQFNPEFMSAVTHKVNYSRSAVLRGHVGPVTCLQALPDGRIVSGGEDGSLRIWSAAGKQAWTHQALISHEGSIDKIQFLPDGRLVSGGADGIVRVWEQTRHNHWNVTPLVGGRSSIWRSSVSCLKALPDGRIVAGDLDGKIHLWSPTADGKWSLQRLYGHTRTVSCVSLLPNGSIVSGGDNGDVRVWVKTGSSTWRSETLEGHGDNVEFVKGLPDGRILSGGRGTKLRLWVHVPSMGWTSGMFKQDPLSHVSVRHSRDGLVIIGSEGSYLCMYRETPDDKWRREELGRHDDCILAVQDLPDGRIVSTSIDRTVRVTSKLPNGSATAETLKCRVDREELGVVLKRNTARFFAEREKSFTQRCKDWAGDLRFYLRNGWDCETLFFLRCMQVLPNGKILLGGSDGRIQLWDGELNH